MLPPDVVPFAPPKTSTPVIYGFVAAVGLVAICGISLLAQKLMATQTDAEELMTFPSQNYQRQPAGNQAGNAGYQGVTSSYEEPVLFVARSSNGNAQPYQNQRYEQGFYSSAAKPKRFGEIEI